ncbi:MAG: hypothetical protein R3248_00680 [Candidatus Promineifilaceae bacterium]|nr:hypothetical protein [Candidatus Promineifilaceae bacterium]
MTETIISLPGISRREWLTAATFSLLICLLLLVPYLLAYTSAGDELVFSDVLMNPEDSQTYFAKMETGYRGDWLYTVPFTTEPHDPFFVGFLYMALGHMARWFGLSLPAVWHAARFLSGAVMFLAIFGFTGLFFHRPRGRWTAFLMATLGSGLGWLLFLVGEPYWLDAFPIDFKMAEARPFFSALTFPHIALTTALMLASFTLTLKALHNAEGRWRNATAAGVVNLLIGIAHPLLVYVIVVAGSLYWLALALRARCILWGEGFALAVTFLLLVPLVLYYAYTLATNEVFAGWDAQREGTLSPPWPHFVVAYGPYLLLAGLFALRRHFSENGQGSAASGREDAETSDESVAARRWLFLWMWVLAVGLLVYAPLNSQRRFVQGVHVALSMLATAGLLHVILPWLRRTRPFRWLADRPRYSPKGMVRLLIVLFLGFMALSNLYVLASVAVSAVVQQPDPIFRPAAEAEAAAWLREHGDMSDVVMGSYQTGNYLAARAGVRVVAGHWAETIAFAEKEADIQAFYDEATAEETRRQLLGRYGVDLVWWGPRERELGAFRPDETAYLQPIYERDEIAIFRVSD